MVKDSAGPEWLRALREDACTVFLCLALVMLPLYRTGVLEDSFNTPKLALALGLGLFSVIALLARKSGPAMGRGWYGVPWLMMGLAAWQAISVLWSMSKPLGVDGTVYFATFGVLAWLFYRGPVSMAGVRLLFHAGSVAAVTTAVWVLLDDFMRGLGNMVARLPDWRGHLAAGLGNSGHIAGMVGMFLPWVLLNFLMTKCARTRWAMLMPAIVLMFAALIVTWSVGSCGASLISVAIWGLLAAIFMPKGSLAWGRLGWVIAAGVAVMVFYFTPNPLNPHSPSLWKEAFSSHRWEEGWPTRIVIWDTTWQIIRESPFFGAGSGNFTFAYTQQVVPKVVADPALRLYAGAFTNDAHNDYLHLWAEGGIVGLGLWLSTLLSFGMTLGKLLKIRPGAEGTAVLIACGAGMTTFALDGLMSFPMRLPAHFLMAVFFLSVPGVVQRLALEQQARIAGRLLPASRRITMGVALLLTLAACTWHHGHRVAAEYYLKTGRIAAESGVVMMTGQTVPIWQACDGFTQQALMGIADGKADAEWRPMLEQGKLLSQGAAMQDAKKYFEKALDANRWYANASSRLGQLLLFQGDYAGVLEIGRRTLKTLDAYEIHERMGAAAYLKGDMKQAANHWRICLERRPASAEYYGALLKRAEP